MSDKWERSVSSNSAFQETRIKYPDALKQRISESYERGKAARES